MDFCNGDTPWGHVGKVADVLDFIVQTTCWVDNEAQEFELPAQAMSGLAFILMACQGTLERAQKEAEEE